METGRQKIVIVGAGLIGAAAAYHLAQSGAEVLVIDAGTNRATDATFGWANASFFQTSEYHALRVAGMAAYKRLPADLSQHVSWCGSLAWEFEGAELQAQVRTFDELGYEARLVSDADIARLEPSLGWRPAQAIHFPQEAAVDAAALMQDFLARSGARVLRGVRVVGFDHSGAQITGVHTSVGAFAADQVLLATGTGTPELLDQIGQSLPMLNRPALVLRTAPVELQINHVLATDFGEVRQMQDGSLLTPASIGHQSDSAETVSHPEDAARVSMERLKALFPSADLQVAEMHLAYRPVPKDGFPAVGPVAPGLFVATMHSGVTLAAAMGEWIAQEMLAGREEDMLRPFRASRFAQNATTN